MQRDVAVMDEPIKISFSFSTGPTPAEPPMPVPSCGPEYQLSAVAGKVYEAMGPGTPTLTYLLIMQRSRLAMEEVILGLDELQRKGKIVLVHRQGDINRQMAFRLI